MKSIDTRKIIGLLVSEGKISQADEKSAKILADNLPKNTILHFAGETPYVIDEATNKIYYFEGDMEDWAYSNFDISLLKAATREQLEDECLLSLQGYAWRNSIRSKLPSINAEIFNKK